MPLNTGVSSVHSAFSDLRHPCLQCETWMPCTVTVLIHETPDFHIDLSHILLRRLCGWLQPIEQNNVCKVWDFSNSSWLPALECGKTKYRLSDYQFAGLLAWTGFGWEIELVPQVQNHDMEISWILSLSALPVWRAALQAVFFWWCVLDYFTKPVGFKCFEKLHESRDQNIHIGFKVTVFPSWQFHSSLASGQMNIQIESNSLSQHCHKKSSSSLLPGRCFLHVSGDRSRLKCRCAVGRSFKKVDPII